MEAIEEDFAVTVHRSPEGENDINVEQSRLKDEGGDAARGPADCQPEHFTSWGLQIRRGKDQGMWVFDETKVTTNEHGGYYEGQDFKCTGKSLGEGGYAGEVEEVVDLETGTVQAMKTVKIDDFEENEVDALQSLEETGLVPKLYAVRRYGDKVIMHMEKIDGVTLEEIIHKMDGLRQRAPGLAYNFSVCVFYDLLSAVREMQDKNWAHSDLHGKNVMLTKELTVKLVDFGNAQRLKKGDDFNYDMFENDILNIMNLLYGLFVGSKFSYIDSFTKKIRNRTLQQVC